MVYQPFTGPQNRTLSAGPLNCRLRFGDRTTEKTVQERYGEFLTNAPSDNLLKILPSPDLVPGKEEFNLSVRVTDTGVGFSSSSTHGFLDFATRRGILNISTDPLDNPATV